MIKNIKKAVEHFEWKLNPKNKQWKATKNDFEAYNTIVDFVEEKHKEQFINNQLFAKLYIKYYSELIRFYNSSVFDSIPKKEISKILDTPIEILINDFVKTVNNIDLENKMISYNIKIKHPRTLTQEERENEKGKFKKEWLDNEAISIEEAENNLTTLINLTLNTYK